jgi:hypothetical protein
MVKWDPLCVRLSLVDAIKVIQPLRGYRNKKNLTNQGGIIDQNNTLQLYTIGF